MWRYRELLPVGDGPVRYPVPVGGTPLLPAPALRQRLGAPRLWIKDETRNPTASNKDRATALVIEDGLRRGSPPDLGRVVVDVQAGPRELRPAVVPAAARAGPVDHHPGRGPPGRAGPPPWTAPDAPRPTARRDGRARRRSGSRHARAASRRCWLTTLRTSQAPWTTTMDARLSRPAYRVVRPA